MAHTIDRQQGIGSRRVVEDIRVPFRAARGEMRIILGAADHKRRQFDVAEIHVEEGKSGGMLRCQIGAAAPRGCQQHASADARIGEILPLQSLAKQKSAGVTAEGVACHGNPIMVQPPCDGCSLSLDLAELIEDRAHLDYALAPEEGPFRMVGVKAPNA
jgi:hypothetical protein